MAISPSPSRELFIGRQQETELFENMLSRQTPEWILHIWGAGGIGKTRLLEQMREEAQATQVDEPLEGVLVTAELIDFYKTANHTFFGLLADIARQLEWIHFGTFQKELDRFRRLLRREPAPEVTERHEAAQRVTDAFFSDYGHLIEDHRVVLFFDTCEEARRMETWLMDTFIPRLVELGELAEPAQENGAEAEADQKHVDHTILVIAGRKHLTFPDDLARYTVTQTLEPFTVAETHEFFREGGLGPDRVTDDFVEQIHQLSEGRLLYIALSFDWLYNEIGTPQELVAPGEPFGERLISWVLRLRGEEDKAILHMALAWRRMHAPLLAHMLQLDEQQASEIIEHLARFSFIKYRPPAEEFRGTIQLHDEMRDLVEIHAWPKFGSEDTRQQLLRQVTQWYEARIQELEGSDVLKGQVPPRHEDTRYLLAEWIYYQMSADIDQGLDSLDPLFRRAAHHLDLAFCELLNEEVDRFHRQLSHAQRDELQFRRALTAFRRERFGEAIDMWLGLLRRADLERKMKATTLMLLTEAKSYTGQPDEAITHGTEAEEIYRELLAEPVYAQQRPLIERERGQLYNNLGYAYRVKGDWSQSLDYYRRSLSGVRSRKGAARTLNNMGYLYAAMGDLVRARSYISRSQKIREQLQIPYELGLSYNTQGIVMEHSGRFDEAADMYSRALAAFAEAGSSFGRGLVLINLGCLQRITNDYEHALTYLEEARRIFDRWGDVDHLTEVLNELGCVYRQRQRASDWDQAERYLTESYELAESLGSPFRQADNLEDLSILYFQWALDEAEQGNEDRYQKYLQKSEEKAREALPLITEFEYTYLESKVLRTFGDVAYERGQVNEAFRRYVDACQRLAELVVEKREPVVQMRQRYEETLDRLQEQLYELPDDQIVTTAKRLLTNLKEEGLDATIPELVRVLETAIAVHEEHLQFIEPTIQRESA